MRRAKILATLGPSSRTAEIIEKLITPLQKAEATAYKLGWSGTLARLGVDAAAEKAADKEILEIVYDRFNYDERPAGYPKDFRTFSVGDVVCLEDRAYQCLANGWQKLDRFNAPSDQTD